MDNFEDFEENGIPFIRTGIALILYLVKNWSVESCYDNADKFITQLKHDLK